MHDKFLKYSEFHYTPAFDKAQCDKWIRFTLKRYSRTMWLNLLSDVARRIIIGSDREVLLSAQRDLIQFTDGIIIHKRANLTLIQFIFDIKESEFNTNTLIIIENIRDIYLLINEFMDVCDVENQNGEINQFILFTTYKTIHTSFNDNDLKYSLEYFNEYYNEIEKQPNANNIKSIASSYLGCDFGEVVNFLKSFHQDEGRRSTSQISFAFQLVGLEYERIDEKWENRIPKLDIPYEFNFFENAAIICHQEKYYVYDVFNLFNSIVRKIYNALFNQVYFDFPNFFGKKIAEPVIIRRLLSQFYNTDIDVLRVKIRSKEYADFGIRYQKRIFLFEIKSTYFKPSIRSTPDIDYFIQSFDGKYVLKSGVRQQINRIKDLDNDYEFFLSQNRLDRKAYTIYPILLLFDESLQCYRRNVYLDQKFQSQASTMLLKNISISNNYASFTINELEALKTKYPDPILQLETIVKFIRMQDYYPDTFRGYLEES